MGTATTSGARTGRPLHRRSRVQLAAMAIPGAFLATACPAGSGTTTPTSSIDPALNHAPVISSFTAARPSAPSPLTTAFQWSIADVDGQALMCQLDLDDDGVFDRTIFNCTSDSLRSATFTAVGPHTVTLSVTDFYVTVQKSVVVTVAPPSADAFNITVRTDGTMTPSQQAAFTNAAARWSQAIRTGLPDDTLNIPANDCGTGAPAFNGTIDDVLIDAAIAPIDGDGNILGQAGPCYVRDAGGLPVYGVMKFDVADVADLEASGDLDAVILHEMGHVLGFGTVWDGHGLIGAGTSNPTFTGVTARGAWQGIGGSGNVPVENLGGPGTADAHWRESVFGGELMTGYIDHNNNPMSTVTIGAFSDFGYGVDLGVADLYGIAFARTGPATPGIDIDAHTTLVRPKGRI